MSDTSGRLLALLSLLQTRRDRGGAELAERLGVTTRTLRRDVQRLRDLGYPVHAVRGIAGYRLGAGQSLPPLLLDDDEAVAVTVGLRTAASAAVTGIEDTALRALGKIERMLPSRLRHRVGPLQDAVVRVWASAPSVRVDALLAIADACQRQQRLRLDYTDHHGVATVRSVEPHRLVLWDRRWYLVGWDRDREDWRTFRADRITPRVPTGPRFTPREPPDGDVLTYLSHQLSSRAWPYQATVTLHEPAHQVADRIWPGTGVIEAVDDHTCRLYVGADTPRTLAWMIASVDADFTLTSAPAELVDALRAYARRCHAAIDDAARD